MARTMRSKSEVELNLASMLDMAFQLLAFFILTFQPPPMESQILMRMPPAKPVIDGDGDDPGKKLSKVQVKPATTLVVTVLASDEGAIDVMQVGVPDKGGMAQTTFPEFLEKLNTFFAGNYGFEQVLLQASPNLRYGELMRVVEICANQKQSDGTPLNRLSFAAIE